MKSFNWKCPYCNQHATITDSSYSEQRHHISPTKKHGSLRLVTDYIICPNHSCKEIVVNAALEKENRLADNILMTGNISRSYSPMEEWQLRPSSSSIKFPDYIPKPIIEDYEESCLIVDLSPKASATLSRRCLQGMIRDFHDIKKKSLADEIKALPEKVNPTTWLAIDGIRKIGNIGAHMEKDINVIVDVEPKEAKKLIQLIELLIKDWYIFRHEREKQLAELIDIADEKTEEKKKSTD